MEFGISFANFGNAGWCLAREAVFQKWVGEGSSSCSDTATGQRLWFGKCEPQGELLCVLKERRREFHRADTFQVTAELTVLNLSFFVTIILLSGNWKK